MTNDVQTKIHNFAPYQQKKAKDNLFQLKINLLNQYGQSLFILLHLEEYLSEREITEIIKQIIDRTCEQINSPILHNARVCLFTNARNQFNELKSTKIKTYNPLQIKIESSENKYLFFLRKIPFERRLIYILRTKENLSYRDLELVTTRYRDEISRILTETREQLRIFLNECNALPFSQPEPLCPVIYKYLSPYLDHELNILHIQEIETHLLHCDKCLTILANHQFIQRQVENVRVPLPNHLHSIITNTDNNESQSETSPTNPHDKKINVPIHSTPRKSILKKITSSLLRFIKR